jgi:YD repeat-containing protein
MKKFSINFKAIIIVFICLMLCCSLIYVPQAFAGEKPRVVPPSADPVDKKDVKFPKQRVNLTTKDSASDERYLEENGLYRAIIKGPGKTKIKPNSVQAKAPTYAPSVTDNICLKNVGGTVTTWVYPDATSKLERYIGNPPTTSNFYVKYDFADIKAGLVIHKATLKFTSFSNQCAYTLSAKVFDAGTSWDSSTMTWATQPTGTTLKNFSVPPTPAAVPDVDITDKFKYYYYSHADEIGLGFSILANQMTNCEATGIYPQLEILYSYQEGGSPSGNDFSFGNGAGALAINSHSGSTVLSQYDIGFGIEGGMSLSFIRTYNSNSVVNYGMGPGWTSNYHQSLTVDNNGEVATLRSGDGSYRCFIHNGSNWVAPDYTRLTLGTESLNSVTYYAVSDKYGNKLYFDYGSGAGGRLLIIKNTVGGQINLGWSGYKLISATDNISSRALSFTYDTYNRLINVSDPQSFSVSYSYNTYSQLVTRTDQNGKYIDYGYDSNGYLYQLENENDKKYTVVYDSNGEGIVQSVKDAYNNTVATYTFGIFASTPADSTEIVNYDSESTTINFDSVGYATSINYPLSLSVSFARDSMKQVTSVTDAKGKTTSLTYDTYGNITQITRPGSITQSFSYNSSHKLTSFTDARNKTTSFSYTNGKLTSISNPLSQNVSFTYGTNGRLTNVSTPYGSGTASWGIGYDSNGYTNSVTSPTGKHWQYSNSITGRVNSYNDPCGNDWAYYYNNVGQLSSAVDPYNKSWSFSYDNAGNLTQLIDPLNRATYYTYDDNARLTKVKNALNHEVEINRLTDGKINWVEDPMNKRTTYGYDDLGRVTTVTNAENETVSVQYDANSNITRITDPLSRQTNLAYDDLNRLTTATNALSKTTTFEYDNGGNVTSVTNPANKETNFGYDDLSRLVSVTDALNNTYTSTYNSAGKLIEVDGPTTAKQEFSYNSDGIMTSSKNSDGKTQSYTYDYCGRVTRITDPLGNHCDFEYDKLNRLTKSYDAMGKSTEFTYDVIGNIVSAKDRKGNTWGFEYDEIYRLKKTTDPLNNVHEYSYDDNSRLTQVKKPPQASPPTVGFSYDNVGRMTSFTDELNHSASFTYNDNGLVTSATDRKSQTFGYSYDSLDRLTQITYPNSSTVSFNYDDLSRLTSFVDSVGYTEFTYDDLSRLTSTDDPWDFTHNLQYNAEGMITQLVAEGDTRNYTWDTAGRMTEATRASQTTDYTYNNNSWVTDIDYPTGTTTDYLYNANGWMTDIDVKKSDTTTILDLVYTYDYNGNITSEPVGASTWNYTYDALNRLTAVDKPGTTDDIVYTYDPRGNRTDIDVGGTVNTDLTFNVADQLTRVDYEDGDYHTYTYDNNGNCTNMSHYPDIFLSSSPPSFKGGRGVQTNEVAGEGAFNPSPSGRRCLEEAGEGAFISSPLISKGEGAQRAGEGVLSTYTPFELAKQYDTTPHEDKRVHYPHLLAPPALRTSNLPSYRPSRFLNPVLWTFATLGNKEKEQQLREYMWKTELPCNPQRTLTPDSVTDYEYDYDNRLVEVSLPTNNDTVEYTYDAMGRRLKKTVTNHTTEALSSPPSFKGGRGVQNPQPAEDTTLSPSTTNTDVTTYKYHYIGSQITEIEINAVRNPGEGQTVLRDEEMKIHLGANSQPISYEWVKHVGGNTTQATYYYHYDIHGNVLKITDSSENVKITYTYDVLGKILTETNPDSILNFFTFRGASQTIWDSEVGMYYSGGYYRPDTGTALQGTGAPVLTNPASGAMLNAVALANQANAQLAAHAMVSAATAGSSSGGAPGGFSPPSGPSEGFAHFGKQGSPPTTKAVETTFASNVVYDLELPILQGMFECDCGSECCSQCKGEKKHRTHNNTKKEEKAKDDTADIDCGNCTFGPWFFDFNMLPGDVQDALIKKAVETGDAEDEDEARKKFENDFMWALWGTDPKTGNIAVMGYGFTTVKQRFFYAPNHPKAGQPVDLTLTDVADFTGQNHPDHMVNGWWWNDGTEDPYNLQGLARPWGSFDRFEITAVFRKTGLGRVSVLEVEFDDPLGQISKVGLSTHGVYEYNAEYRPQGYTGSGSLLTPGNVILGYIEGDLDASNCDFYQLCLVYGKDGFKGPFTVQCGTYLSVNILWIFRKRYLYIRD